MNAQLEKFLEEAMKRGVQEVTFYENSGSLGTYLRGVKGAFSEAELQTFLGSCNWRKAISRTWDYYHTEWRTEITRGQSWAESHERGLHRRTLTFYLRD